jgi:hypothetical protein
VPYEFGSGQEGSRLDLSAPVVAALLRGSASLAAIREAQIGVFEVRGHGGGRLGAQSGDLYGGGLEELELNMC